jgi:DNA primase
MIRTSNIICNITDVPASWVYEFYCNLTEPLTGQRVNLKSFGNPNDTRPSLFIYFSNGNYVWKDFSTGKFGNHITLVQEMYGVAINEAIRIILADYAVFLKDHPDGFFPNSIVKQTPYRVDKIVTRIWNNFDAKYWTDFGITSSILERFNVKAIESFSLVTEDDSRPEIKFRKNYLYGYFTAAGDIAKIYQPYNKDLKFIKVQNYIQGTDQLEFVHPNLVICSSLKDAMSLITFGYNIEVVAPDSENTIIKPEVIDIYKKKYQSICTLFDNDRAGIESMTKYKAMYNIPMVHFKAEKDIADSVRAHGLVKTREMLTPLLKEALKK